MTLARPGVEAQGNLVEFGLAVDGQVGSLRQVLPQQSVRVPVSAAATGCAGRRSTPAHRYARSTHRGSPSLCLGLLTRAEI